MGVIRPNRRSARIRRAAALALCLAVVGLLAQVGTGGSTAGAVTVTTCGGEVPAPKADGTAWTCMFDDEFNDSTLGPAWVPTQSSQTGVATGTAPYRACYVNSSNNISESNGVLKLTVRKEKSTMTCKLLGSSFTTNYTAGSVSSVGKFWQTYGRFTVRAKLPDTALKGLQETLWMWPVNSAKYAAYGPAYTEPSGEIDFAELYSAQANWNFPYIHYNVDTTQVNRTTSTNVYAAPYEQSGMSCGMDHSQWNVYTLDWQPGRITMYVNGNACLVDNYVPAGGLSSPAPFDSPFFIALSQELGVKISNSDNATNSKTQIPATTQIDYVRVWK